MINYLSFPSSVIVFIYPSFLKVIFTQYRISVDRVFVVLVHLFLVIFAQNLKNVCYLVLTSKQISYEKSIVISFFFPTNMSFFYSYCFPDIFFVLKFHKFDHDVSSFLFLYIILVRDSLKFLDSRFMGFLPHLQSLFYYFFECFKPVLLLFFNMILNILS